MLETNPYESPHDASAPLPAKKPRFTFTVVEVLVAIAILGTLIPLYVGPYLEHRRWGKMRERRQLLQPPVMRPVEKPVNDAGFSGNPSPNQP